MLPPLVALLLSLLVLLNRLHGSNGTITYRKYSEHVSSPPTFVLSSSPLSSVSLLRTASNTTRSVHNSSHHHFYYPPTFQSRSLSSPVPHERFELLNPATELQSVGNYDEFTTDLLLLDNVGTMADELSATSTDAANPMLLPSAASSSAPQSMSTTHDSSHSTFPSFFASSSSSSFSSPSSSLSSSSSISSQWSTQRNPSATTSLLPLLLFDRKQLQQEARQLRQMQRQFRHQHSSLSFTRFSNDWTQFPTSESHQRKTQLAATSAESGRIGGRSNHSIADDSSSTESLELTYSVAQNLHPTVSSSGDGSALSTELDNEDVPTTSVRSSQHDPVQTSYSTIDQSPLLPYVSMMSAAASPNRSTYSISVTPLTQLKQTHTLPLTLSSFSRAKSSLVHGS